MITAFLKIAGLIVGILDRYLEEQARTRKERELEEFKKDIVRSDFELIAAKLSRRLREARRSDTE
jgi:hypothetical protein